MTEDNYDVKIKIEKNVFIEGVHSKAEAIRRATGFVQELLISGIKPFAKIVAVKTNDSQQDSSGGLLDEQIKQVQQTSLDLSNVFNKDELKLLIEDLKFYTGA